MSRNTLLQRTSGEMNRAMAKHGAYHSHHEAYGVMLEEVDEVWHEVKQQRPHISELRAELIQVAAVALRWAEELCIKKEGES